MNLEDTVSDRIRLSDVNYQAYSKSQFGWSALHDAARRNQVEIAEILISHGADVNNESWVNYPSIPISDIALYHYNDCSKSST